MTTPARAYRTFCMIRILRVATPGILFVGASLAALVGHPLLNACAITSAFVAAMVGGPRIDAKLFDPS